MGEILVVEFFDNSCEIVHKKWLLDDQFCAYPDTLSKVEIYDLIKNSANPENYWDAFQYSSVLGYFGKY